MNSDLGCIRQRTAPMVLKRFNTYPPSTPPVEKSSKYSITPNLLPIIDGVPSTSIKLRKSHYKTNQPIEEPAKSPNKIEPSVQLLKIKIEPLPVITLNSVITQHANAPIPELDLVEINSTGTGIINKDINKMATAFKKPVVSVPASSSCVCGRDNGDDMIGCNGPNCPREWFHIGCVGLARRKVKYMSSWYCRRCSNKCRKHK